MSRTEGGSASKDTAGWLLATAVWLLPAGRREWGRAMQAELAAIGPRRDRRRFAVGCTRMAMTQPAMIGTVGYPLLTVAALVAVVTLTGPIDYPPLHAGLIGLVAVLVTVSWLGRQLRLLGPVGDGRAARMLRAGGCLLIAAMVSGVVLRFRSATDNLPEKASVGVPAYTVVLTIYLLGFVIMTARRSAATGPALAIGGASGVAAGAVWSVLVLVHPPVPDSALPAVAVIGAAAGVTALITAWGRGSGETACLAAACTGTVAALLIVLVTHAAVTVGPVGWVPPLAPVALTTTDQLAQSRIEAEDPYVAVLLLGCLLAAASSALNIAAQRAQRHPVR